MPRRGSPYGEPAYVRALEQLRRTPARCHLCGKVGARSIDHVPALGLHTHVAGSGCCRLLPAHLSCNQESGGWRVANANRRRRGARVKRPASRSSLPR
ncbi:hypothetical protein [Desertimonas flava]|uniref:hypothetical protein n=1 Tax=Desertimonas flava TaxID=2064846 RepID=UPI0013C41F0F|nr:hypothetical protein [Desertimonas flava]